MNLGEQIVHKCQNETFTKTLKDFKVVKYYHETVLEEYLGMDVFLQTFIHIFQVDAMLQ